MPCADDRHDWVAVNPLVHPTEKDGQGRPLEVLGAPPQSAEEPAWCRSCGALRNKKPKGLMGLLATGETQWALSHPAIDKDATTIANMMRDTDKAKRARVYLAIVNGLCALSTVAPLSERTAEEIEFLQRSLWDEMGEFQQRILGEHAKIIKKEWADMAAEVPKS